MRNIDAAEEAHLLSELFLDGGNVAGVKRLERVNDVHAEGNDIGQQFCNDTVAVEHDLCIRIVFLDHFDEPFDVRLDKFAEHHRGSQQICVACIIVAGQLDHVKIFTACLHS